MKQIRHKIKKNRKIIDIIAILITAFILSMPMLNKYIDIYLDDGSQHLMRAYHTYQTILQNGSDNVISNFANGFGYSWNLFYGPLSNYFIIILGIIFGTFNVGLKLVVFMTLFLSGLFMYQLIHEMTDNKNTALLAAIIYMTSPYFFTDLYVRHAMGECMAFIFIPMVFLGLYNLFNTEKNHYYLIFGVTGLILSHNISTVLTAIFALVYCVINITNIKRTHVKKGIIIDILFIFLITAFFWMPFLETKYYTDYRVYEKDAMATQESLLNSTLHIKDLVITQKGNIFIFEIGLPVVMMLAFSIMTYKNLQEDKKEYLFFLISGFISIWMSTRYFPWKILPNSAYIIQFSWRMLLFSSFFFAIVCSINMTTVIKNFNCKDVFVISLLCIIYFWSRYGVIQYSENISNVQDYPISQITGQDNEWLPGMGRLEYLPSKAYDNTFYIATRDSGIIVLEGNCEIQENTKEGTYLLAQIVTENEKAKLELPFINYPGYTVRFDGIIIDTFETENGFLGCLIENHENGILEVKYTGTKLMNFSQILSLTTYIIFILYVWKKH